MITASLASLKDEILTQDEKFVTQSSTDTNTFKGVREILFHFRRQHLLLHRQLLFGQELARNLCTCFDKLQRKYTSDRPGERKVAYSATLREIVVDGVENLATLKLDLENLPLRIDAQQSMLDSQMSINIARNSDMTADEARNDSSAMRTLAIVTVVFLPGTFIAVSAFFPALVLKILVKKGPTRMPHHVPLVTVFKIWH
jgi:hypothetical protein